MGVCQEAEDENNKLLVWKEFGRKFLPFLIVFMATPVTLYAHWVSQPSRAVGWFCLLNKIEFNFEFIDFFAGAHKTEEFQNLSPNGLIPVLKDDSIDLVIAESHAILQYLAEKANADSWFPSDPKTKAKVLQYLHWHHLNTRKLTTVLFKPVVLGALGLGPSVDAEQATKDVSPALERINNWLSNDTFLCGTATPTIADLSCYCEIDQLKLFNLGKLDSYPNIITWIAKMEQLPSHEEAHKGLQEFFASSKDKFQF